MQSYIVQIRNPSAFTFVNININIYLVDTFYKHIYFIQHGNQKIWLVIKIISMMNCLLVVSEITLDITTWKYSSISWSTQ